MPKFYGQNKKFRDPRYFLNEGNEDLPPWTDPEAPVSDPMARAKELANKGMAAASESPWDSVPQEPLGTISKQGDVTTLSGTLSDGTPLMAVINDVRKHLNIPGGKAVLQKFDMLLKQMGITPGAAPSAGSEVDTPESEAEERM